MEEDRKEAIVGSAPPPLSSSSLTNELFGSKESALARSPTATFSSIFPPPPSPTVMGKSSSASELVGSIERDLIGNRRASEYECKNKEDPGHFRTSKERNSAFQEKVEPCPLSSSLYYGGLEDMYMRSSNACKKGESEDDQNGNNSQSASRGNWWQGSLYY